MESYLYCFELVGVVAFAISGSLVAIEKQMDLLGVVILGVVTAVGGGMIRDLLLGCIPPAIFQDTLSFGVAAGTSLMLFLVLFLRSRYRKKQSSHAYLQWLLFLSDSIGLGIFTVVGVQRAIQTGHQTELLLPVFVGVLTGVGGGVIRDLFAGNIPYIFVKHIYASASILGALVCALLWNMTSRQIAMLTGFLCVFTIRCLAAYFKWNLPKLRLEEK